MSRIGKLPVHLPAGVTVTVDSANVVKVKGPLGELSQKVDPDIKVNVEGDVVTVTRPTDQPRHRSMHGLYRALIKNMVVGVSDGYTIKQELVGVGYRVEVQGQIVILSLGYSHDIYFELPKEVKGEAEPVKKGQNPVLVLKPRFARSASLNRTRVRVSSLSVKNFVAKQARVPALNNRR